MAKTCSRNLYACCRTRAAIVVSWGGVAWDVLIKPPMWAVHAAPNWAGGSSVAASHLLTHSHLGIRRANKTASSLRKPCGGLFFLRFSNRTASDRAGCCRMQDRSEGSVMRDKILEYRTPLPPRWQMPGWCVLLVWVYPLVPILLLYGTWLLASVVVGHAPGPTSTSLTIYPLSEPCHAMSRS